MLRKSPQFTVFTVKISDKFRSVKDHDTVRSRYFVISVNMYTIKNCRIRNTFYFEAARRVEGNYVKTRTNNLRIFHANGHEKKNEEVEVVINLIRMISEP